MTNRTKRIPAALAALLVVAGLTAAASAADAEAYSARPFGVGRVTVSLDPSETESFDTNAFQIIEANERVLYPAFVGVKVGKILDKFLGADSGLLSNRLTVYFLFRGDDPLSITLLTPTTRQFSVVPQRPTGGNPRTDGRINRFRDRLFGEWWRRYNESALEQIKRDDYAPILENYLLTMLSHRLSVAPPPTTQRYWSKQQLTPPQQSLDLLLGTDKMRAAIMRESLLGVRSVRDRATLPPPAEISWLPPELPEMEVDTVVDIEPIAMHVPVDCFYIHFGRFNNYLWMEHLMDDYGGDLAPMVTLRSHNPGRSARFQRQIALKQSALAEIFGEQAIADAAIIGRDLFQSEGAAMGILFQARNNLILRNDLMAQRADAATALKDQGATIETLKIAGRDVSFASTPDNRLRSFYANDGDYHLVTTSRRLVEEFFEAGQGSRSLGQSASFHHARTIMPRSREDTIFVYMSPEFFQGLLSPQYRIELRRRLQAVTDLELIKLARLTAAAEQAPHDTIEQLIAGGYLPAGFDRRSDGSGPILENERALDSLRGARGTFTPVADIPLKAVTEKEASDFTQVVGFHQEHWQQMDPLMVGIKRYALNDTGLERIVIDARVTPFVRQKYGWVTSIVGPPLQSEVTPVPGDIVSVQGVVRGGSLLPPVRMHHVYFGVQDTDPVVDLSQGGILTWLRFARSAPCYFGAWPKPGYLDRLPFGLAPQSDQFGYARLLFGLWRREWAGFSTFCFHQPLLAYVSENLQSVEAEEAAQLRVQVGDLSQARITSTANALTYQRGKQASVGNTRFLNMLSEQMHVTRADALTTAERLLDTQLVCPLGGEYELEEHPSGLRQWISSIWREDRGMDSFTVPEDFKSPLLGWFRGVKANGVMGTDELIVHAELDMQRKERDAPVVELPKFDLGNLWGAFGQKKKTEDDKNDPDDKNDKNDKTPEEESGTGAREF